MASAGNHEGGGSAAAPVCFNGRYVPETDTCDCDPGWRTTREMLVDEHSNRRTHGFDEDKHILNVDLIVTAAFSLGNGCMFLINFAVIVKFHEYIQRRAGLENAQEPPR
ncbi:unnamed protein product, partial [Durusdinium trenchii]